MAGLAFFRRMMIGKFTRALAMDVKTTATLA
jgi:hypothetical protein